MKNYNSKREDLEEEDQGMNLEMTDRCPKTGIPFHKPRFYHSMNFSKKKNK